MKFRLQKNAPRVLLLVLVPAAISSANIFATGAFGLRLQVAAGDSVPGSQDSVVFHSILDSYSNNRNQIVFAATFGKHEPDGLMSRSPWGLFLKGESGIKKILAEGDIVPGGRSFSIADHPLQPPIFAINDNGNVAVVDLDYGVFLYREGQLHWVVRPGTAVPGSSLTLKNFAIVPRDRFFNQKDEIAFAAGISDSAFGLFLFSKSSLIQVAAGGDPVSDRPTKRFAVLSFRYVSLILSESSLLFQAAVETPAAPGLFVFSNSSVRTIAIVGDPLPEGTDTLDEISAFDLNAREQIAISFRSGTRFPREAFLYLSFDTKLRRIAGGDIAVPGFIGKNPNRYSKLSLDSQGRLFFAAQIIGQRAGFFLWDRGEIQKIALDGEPTPLGGAFALGKISYTIDLTPPPLEGYPFNFDVSQLNESREVAFVSDIRGSDTPTVPFVWKAGILEAVCTARSKSPEIGDRLLESLSTISLDRQGRAFFKARLCCDAFDSALYTAEPDGTRIQYLPLIATGGNQSDVAYSTTVVVSNQSAVPGFVSVEGYTADGNILPLPLSRDFIVYGGEARQLSIVGTPKIISGYLKIRVDGGADVAVSGTIRLIKNNRIESQTGLAASPLLASAALLSEIAARVNTGIAVSNPNARNNPILFRLVNAQGRTAFERKLILAPGQQVTLFVSELFPDLLAEFVGLLRVSGESPFLIAGLRLSELKLSPLPVDPQPDTVPFRSWGFANLVPPSGGHHWIDSTLQAFVNDKGHVVLLTGSHEIKLVQPNGPATVLNRDTLLPESGSKVRTDVFPPVNILGFNNNDEILFTALLQNGLLGMYLWREETIRKVALSSELQLPGLAIEYTLRSFAVLNESGVVAIQGGSGIFVYDGSLRKVIFGGSSPFRSVDLNSSGTIAFATGSEVGLFDGRDVKFIAQAGDVFGRFRIGELIRAKISENGRIFFTAFSDFPVRPGEQRPTGFFVFDGTTIKPLLLSGDALPGQPGAVIGTIDSPNSPGRPPFRVNRNNLAALFNSSRIFVFDDRGQLKAFLPGPVNPQFAFQGGNYPYFYWNDANQLLLETSVLQGDRWKRALSIWENGAMRVALREGDRMSPSAEAAPALLRSVDTAWDFSNSGLFLFQAGVVGEGASGLYVGVPGNLHQYFIPHVAQGNFSGNGYASTLLLHNKANTPSSVTVDLFTSKGVAIRGWAAVTLNGGEVKTVSLAAPASEFGRLPIPDQLAGWALVSAVGGQTQVFARISVSNGNTLASEVTVPASNPASIGFWSSSPSNVFAGDTGVALVNPYNTPVDVELEQLGTALQVEDKIKVTLPELGYKAALISEFFSRRLSVSKIFRLRSTLPVPVTVLQVNGSQITSLPVSNP